MIYFLVFEDGTNQTMLFFSSKLVTHMSLILLPAFLLEAIVSLFVKAEFERNRENILQHKSYLKFWYPAWHLNGLTLKFMSEIQKYRKGKY